MKVGYDGIVFANSKEGASFEVTPLELYLALAKDVPKQMELLKKTHIQTGMKLSNFPIKKLKY